ncbi:MAG: glycosyltransferase [Sphingomonas sp.]|uniref:glycosyltransferase n=1 Tax=Sphingomonas sp. TaxID=28214 RepID=UPI0025F3FA95|nr:glycosyltransferase [Sphingomonas sp.]MBX3565275.1 glycosyltransferase [Sphingomonas sp.]
MTIDKGINVAFLGSGRCFHTDDWYRSTLKLLGRPVPFVTDNYEGDGLPTILQDSDDVRELLIIDPLIFAKSASLGHKWRNLLKLLLTPLQALLLRRQLRKLGKPFLIAHSTYYAFVASFTGAAYSSTPQGSEVLVRPASRLYRWLLQRSLRHARFATVDSEAMKAALERLTDTPVHIVQNGIDVAAAQRAASPRRDLVLSIRGITENYRIAEIFASRDASAPDVALTLVYPFTEQGCFDSVQAASREDDRFLGRVDRQALYAWMAQSICVVSIPESDSSPRSVYEAIFAGAAALCSPSRYIESLPACMRARIVTIDIAEADWLARGLAQAQEIVRSAYRPSEAALTTFDQLRSMEKMLGLVAQSQAAAPLAGQTV